MSDNNSTKEKLKKNSITTPKALERYLRVTSPASWVIVIAILVIIIGVLVLCTFGKVEVKERVAVQNVDGTNYALISKDYLDVFQNWPYVTIGDEKYFMSNNIEEPLAISDDTSVYIKVAGNLESGDIVYPVTILDCPNQSLTSGTIVVDSFSPITLLLNS